MDPQLSSAEAFDSNSPPGGMPPEAPMGMPAQDLHYKPWHNERRLISDAVLYARFKSCASRA
jgi:hypothetical protein